MSRQARHFDAHLSWTEIALALLVVALITVNLFSEDRALKQALLILLTLVPVGYAVRNLLRAFRHGRIGAATRADRPRFFWTVVAGNLLLIAVIPAALWGALLD